jgi:hypothetical protein
MKSKATYLPSMHEALGLITILAKKKPQNHHGWYITLCEGFSQTHIH